MSIPASKRIPSFSTVVVAAAVLLCAAAPAAARDTDKKTPLPFEQSQIFIEFNSTDNDLGFQVKLDAEDWKYVKILSPDGRTVYESRGKSGFGQLGLSELFFEGAE